MTEHQKSYQATLTFLSPHYSHLDFQALKGPVASLGLQASLDRVEIKESLEVQDWFTSLNCQVREGAHPHMLLLLREYVFDCGSHPPIGES